MAGHSKFKNIQHRKGAQDKRRARQFSRLAREITAAAKIGAPDPDANPRLRTAILNARAANMPKDNIARAIGKSRDGKAAQYEEIRYEGFTAGGAGIIMESLTDNRNRTASDVRALLSKKGGTLAETNAVSFMFARVGEVFYPSETLQEDDALEAALNASADDSQTTEDGHFFFSTPQDLARLADALEEVIGAPGVRRLAWRPQNAIPLSSRDKERYHELLNELDDYDDIQNVYANAADDEGNPTLKPPL